MSATNNNNNNSNENTKEDIQSGKQVDINKLPINNVKAQYDQIGPMNVDRDARQVLALGVLFIIGTATLLFMLALSILLVCIGLRHGGMHEIEKLAPYFNLVLTQTLYPLATCALGYYFAASRPRISDA